MNPARKPAVSASGSSAPSRPADRAATLVTTVEMPAEQEPGTLLYVLHRSRDEPDLFWVCDLYADDDAFAVHRTAVTGVDLNLPKHVIEYRRRAAGNVRPPEYSRIRNSIQIRPRGR